MSSALVPNMLTVTIKVSQWLISANYPVFKAEMGLKVGFG